MTDPYNGARQSTDRGELLLALVPDLLDSKMTHSFTFQKPSQGWPLTVPERVDPSKDTQTDARAAVGPQTRAASVDC